MHPYPIPKEEEDGVSLIIASSMGDLNWNFCRSSGGILRSKQKSKNDFLLVEAPGRLVVSRNEQNHTRTRPWGSYVICSISFVCLHLSTEVGWVSSSSIAYGIVIASHLRSFGVKTGGLSSSILSKLFVSCLKVRYLKILHWGL